MGSLCVSFAGLLVVLDVRRRLAGGLTACEGPASDSVVSRCCSCGGPPTVDNRDGMTVFDEHY